MGGEWVWNEVGWGGRKGGGDVMGNGMGRGKKTQIMTRGVGSPDKLKTGFCKKKKKTF